MKSNYSPSINIIRDQEKEMDYIVTKNAEKAAARIVNEFHKGIHAFSIIGSYGTGKSSFLWAFQKSLKSDRFFDLDVSTNYDKIKTINIVGSFQSMIEAFNEQFNIDEDFSSNQKLFDQIFATYQELGKNGLLIICIDEFGKFLEYASKNNPDKEMYFIQQLAEFVNDPNRNILLVTTLHQSVGSYGSNLADSQRNEWEKVRGRLTEITFNEPVEHLLNLAGKHFQSVFGTKEETKYSKQLITLQLSNDIFPCEKKYFESLKNDLYPLDVFAAYTLTTSLQRYGQNERSLFSFIQSSEDIGLEEKVKSNSYFSIPDVYNYLNTYYYNVLKGKSNPDLAIWLSIKHSIERAEVLDLNINLAENILKTIGLLKIFSSKAAKIDLNFISSYFSNSYSKKEVEDSINSLVKAKILRYSKFDFSYKLFEGTDIDIESELDKAESNISEQIDIIPKLNNTFEFPIVTAKSVSYEKGTPRLFEYLITDKPERNIAEGEIDGFINLIFNANLEVEKIKKITADDKTANIYAYFKNIEKITSTLLDIEKTDQVLRNIKSEGDKVAIKELSSIRRSNEALLNHYVLDALFKSDVVEWIYQGNIVTINSKKELNKFLSIICNEVYDKTPVLKNELFNKHKPSGVIAGARKNLFKALVNNFDQNDIGFEETKFPAEKTIYYTLFRESGIHKKQGSSYVLEAPDKKSDLYILWDMTQQFLDEAKKERKPITDLMNTLTTAPYKMKQGVVDFWVPTVLFIRRGDFALYSEGNFKPHLNEVELFLMTKTPQHYEVKSFELNDLRIKFFNKYRSFLQQNESDKLGVTTFIESIRPILLMYMNLTDYAKNTNKISKEAKALREVIKNAKDPETIFFDQFPKALGFETQELLKSEKYFDEYINKFQTTIDELNNTYEQLLNRIELFISKEMLGEKLAFPKYKNRLTERFKGVKEHHLIPKQKTLIQRINSPLNDRDSWIASIAQTVIGKTLSGINDQDELFFKERLKHFVQELDNLVELEKTAIDNDKEEVFKLDITSQRKGMSPHILRIQKATIKAKKEVIDEINNSLGTEKQTRITILAKLLKDELENE